MVARGTAIHQRRFIANGDDMGKNRLLSGRLLLGVVLLHCSAHAENASETVNAEKAPRVFIADSAVLPRVRALVQQDAEGDTPFADAYARLCSDADAWLDTGPFSVMSKTGMPPSGDKHDYWSVGPYWWPDPGISGWFALYPPGRQSKSRVPARRVRCGRLFDLQPCGT